MEYTAAVLQGSTAGIWKRDNVEQEVETYLLYLALRRKISRFNAV